MKDLAQALRNKKLKITPQRLSVYGVLSGTKMHPDAEWIHQSLSRDYPSLSLATVYKTLDTLRNSGLIQEINVGEDKFRYDANPAEHPHLICTACRSIIDCESAPHLNPLRDKIQSEYGFNVQKEQIFFYGICKECGNTQTLS